MDKTSKMLQLFRYKNLLFIVLIQWLIFYAIITPILNKYGLMPLLPAAYFWLIVAATVLIAAGSYVINDYFDLKIDQINRPDSVVIGNIISKRTAMNIYRILTAVGIAVGLLVAFILKNSSLGLIFVIVPGMMWFYSSSYKRQFLLGNIIVALCSALSVLVVLVAESGLQTGYYGDLIQQTPVLGELFRWVCGYAAFAFVLTLIREIIKDIEDMEGDRQMECRTLPIVWGKNNALTISSVLLGLSTLSVFIIEHLFIKMPQGSTILNIFSPSTICIIYFALFITFAWSKKNKNSYGILSLILKLLMLSGTLYMLVFYYIFAKTWGLTMFGIFHLV